MKVIPIPQILVVYNKLCKMNMEQYIVSVPQALTFELGKIEIEINK